MANGKAPRGMTPERAQAIIDWQWGPGEFRFDGFHRGKITMKPIDVTENWTEADWHEWYTDNGEDCDCADCKAA